jgi:hypothetical protein
MAKFTVHIPLVGIGISCTLAQELVTLPQAFVAITRKKLKEEL